RVALAAAALLPLGTGLGMFMPIGLRAVARTTTHPEEFVAWSWAVNCFCSVVSSVLATILAMTIGFTAVLLTALAIYLVGIAVLMAGGLYADPGASEGVARGALGPVLRAKDSPRRALPVWGNPEPLFLLPHPAFP